MIKTLLSERDTMMKFMIKTFLGVGVFFIVVISGFYFFQEKLLFRPNTRVFSNQKYTNEFIKKDEVNIPILHSLKDSCDTVILFFHGNGGNIYTQDMMYGIFDETEQCFLAIEYPGYGLYDGKITSINDLYEVGEIGFSYLRDKGYTNQTIIPRGYSMGGGVASYISHTYSTDQLVLQSTYTSLGSIAQLHFPFLPVKYLFKYNMKTNLLLQEYEGEVIIFHGRFDATVPHEEALKNYAILNEEMSELVLYDGGHNVFPREPFINTISKNFTSE